MYALIRIIILVAVIFAVVRLRRSQMKKAARWIVSVLLIAFLIFSNAVPFENAFVSFDSPEAAFRYRYYGSASLRAAVPGPDCALVVGTQLDRTVVFAAREREDGWKMGSGFDLSSRSSVVSDGVYVTLYSIRGDEHTYVSVIHHGDRELAFSDRYGSDYTAVCYDSGNGYHAHWVSIPEPVPVFSLNINGEDFIFAG